MPKLSVITICRNDKAGLEKTMRSVFAQTFTDYEYVVIDGASTDGSAELVKENSSRLAFWISEKDKGIYNAQNKGWQNAKGEYCLFLNSGDFLADATTLGKIFSAPFSEDIIYGDLLVDNGKDKPYRLSQPDPFTFEDMIRTTLFHPAALIRRTLLGQLNGYDESFRITADYDFFLHALLVKKCSSRYIPVPFSVFNTAGIGSDPKNKAKHDAERRRAQLKYFSLPEIEAGEKAARKKMPRSVRLKAAVERIPVIREIVGAGIVFYSSIRKILS
jgi:glycosyltransferase involved in cell wall biosynthesis